VKSILSLDLFGDRLPAEEARDDGGEHRRMLLTLKNAAKGELTGRQLDCLRMRYQEGKKVSEIAQELGIRPPTVSKHLKKARVRLEKVMRYSFPKL
jgi:RNA polymerase sigma factor (sigma-70 family)